MPQARPGDDSAVSCGLSEVVRAGIVAMVQAASK
jgi:hypothetical protein